jgi:hypothetical protein
LSRPQVDEALADLDRLCIDEYGYGIIDLVDDPDDGLAVLRLNV